MAESPLRGWREFLLDGWKQAMGHCLVHLVNLREAARPRPPGDTRDECALYLAVYLLDLGLRLPLLCLLSDLVQKLLGATGLRRLLNGNYTRRCTQGAAFDLWGYLAQVALWLGQELATKLLLARLHPPLLAAMATYLQTVLATVAPRPRQREALTLVALPLSLNLVSTWVTDGLLRRGGPAEASLLFLEEHLRADLHSVSTNASLHSPRGQCVSKQSVLQG